MDFVKNYVTLMQYRYDGIMVKYGKGIFNTPGYVCPLGVQSLVDNAIKHNRHGKDACLQICITTEDNRVVVTNNILPLDIIKEGPGTGLKTLKDRYSLLTDKEVYISLENSSFTVSLPLLYIENLKDECFNN